MFGLFRRTPKVPADPHVKQDDAQTFRVRVRTRLHGETVEIRFTKQAHIAVADGGGYVFRKGVVSPQHFDRGEISVHFDDRYAVTHTEASGAEFIPVQDWED